MSERLYSPGSTSSVKLRRVAQRPDADERIGEHRAREGAAGDVVDRVEHGDLLVIDLTLPFEHLDGPLDHVAQTGALALREVADGVVHVVGRVAVAGEDRLVDAQRVGLHALAADVGVGEERIVENLRQRVVGDDLVAGAGGQQQHEGRGSRHAEESFHNRSVLIILRTVMFERRAATAANDAATTARSVGRNSTG